MVPDNLHFGGGAAGTILHPLVAIEMVIAIILILALPRKSVIAPFLWMIFTVPIGQVVVLAGAHFTIIRIIILAGLARRVISQRASSSGETAGGFNSIDRPVVFWAISELVIITTQYRETQAFIQSLGDCLDLLGGYFAVRFMIQDRNDVRFALKVFAVITAVTGCCMINEQLTGQNVFGILGGVSLYPQVRDGQIRSQGAFASYIEAGVFGANLIPLFIWLWSDRKSRGMAVLGILGGTIMVFTCHSSTPLLSYAAALLGFFLWRFRTQMRLIRQGLVAGLIGLHLVMKAPVWALIARVDLTGSSSGYHRYMLVDNCIRHFSDWWLIGFQNYPAWGWDMWDLSDQYVAVCLGGGLLSFICFIWVLSRSFSSLGTARKHAAEAGDHKVEWLLWCLGVALFANIMAWFGCAAWAKGEAALSALLAMICVATFEAAHLSFPQPQEAPAPSYESVTEMNWEAQDISH